MYGSQSVMRSKRLMDRNLYCSAATDSGRKVFTADQYVR